MKKPNCSHKSLFGFVILACKFNNTQNFKARPANETSGKITCFKSYKSTPPSTYRIKSFRFPLPGENRILDMHVLLVLTTRETCSFKSQIFSWPSISAWMILLLLNASEVIGATKFCKKIRIMIFDFFFLVFSCLWYQHLLTSGGIFMPSCNELLSTEKW